MDFNEIINYNFDYKLIASINASKDFNLMHPSLNRLIELELKLIVYQIEKLNEKERELVYLKFILPSEREEIPFYAKGLIVVGYDYSSFLPLFANDFLKVVEYLEYQFRFESQLSNQLSVIRRFDKIKNLPELFDKDIAFFFQLLRGSGLRTVKWHNNKHCMELCIEFNFIYVKRITDFFNKVVEKHNKVKVIDKLLPKLPDDIKIPLNEFVKNEGDNIYSNSYKC